MEHDATTPLSAVEARVLGCLIEKESTTPDAYPLTLNSLRNACNQSTSRDPVMRLADHEVDRALASLRERGLTRTVHSTSNRATKYRHVVPDEMNLEHPATAVLAVLLLRGPQTIGELKARTERIHSFSTTDDVAEVLTDLAAQGIAQRLERRPGQKDARWVELLSDVTPLDGEHAGVEPNREPAAVDVDSAGGVCCAAMQIQVHASGVEALIVRLDRGQYVLSSGDASSAIEPIRYCPWCGADLSNR